MYIFSWRAYTELVVNVTCLSAPEEGRVSLETAVQGNQASCLSDMPGCSGIWRCALCPSGRSEKHKSTHSEQVSTSYIDDIQQYHHCPLDDATAPKFSTVKGMMTSDDIERLIFVIMQTHTKAHSCHAHAHKQIKSWTNTCAGGDCMGLLSRTMCCSCRSFL